MGTFPVDADAFHKVIVDNLFDGVYYVDRGRTITYWNQGAERISGYTAAELVGRRCFDNILQHVDDEGCGLCRHRCPMVAAMATGRPQEAHVYLHHRQGHRVPVMVRTAPIRDPDGTVVGAVEIFNDDTAFRDASHEIDELRAIAQVDPLTGLRNRRSLELSLRSRLRDARGNDWPLGVIFVDIDHFKRINDRARPRGR